MSLSKEDYQLNLIEQDDDNNNNNNIDEEELTNLKEIRIIEQQALLSHTYSNNNKTNNISTISNHPSNNGNHSNRARQTYQHPTLLNILDTNSE